MLDNYLEIVKKTNLVETDLCIQAHAYAYEYIWNYFEKTIKLTSSDKRKKAFSSYLGSFLAKRKTRGGLAVHKPSEKPLSVSVGHRMTMYCQSDVSNKGFLRITMKNMSSRYGEKLILLFKA